MNTLPEKYKPLLQALASKDEVALMNSLVLVVSDEQTETPIGDALKVIINILADDEDKAFQFLACLWDFGPSIFKQFAEV